MQSNIKVLQYIYYYYDYNKLLLVCELILFLGTQAPFNMSTAPKGLCQRLSSQPL